MKRKYAPTPEQQAKAAEKRAKMRELAGRISKLSEEQRQALVQDWPTTIEGHRLSLHNACMIAYQGGATVVGGFRQWIKAGRCVKKGESGKCIWVPLSERKSETAASVEVIETETPEGKKRMRFMLATVFDISQTRDSNAAIGKDEEKTGLPSLTAAQASGRVNVLDLA